MCKVGLKKSDYSLSFFIVFSTIPIQNSYNRCTWCKEQNSGPFLLKKKKRNKGSTILDIYQTFFLFYTFHHWWAHSIHSQDNYSQDTYSCLQIHSEISTSAHLSRIMDQLSNQYGAKKDIINIGTCIHSHEWWGIT